MEEGSIKCDRSLNGSARGGATSTTPATPFFSKSMVDFTRNLLLDLSDPSSAQVGSGSTGGYELNDSVIHSIHSTIIFKLIHSQVGFSNPTLRLVAEPDGPIFSPNCPN